MCAVGHEKKSAKSQHNDMICHCTAVTRKTLATGSGSFGEIWGSSGRLWGDLGSSGWLWGALVCSGATWAALAIIKGPYGRMFVLVRL